MLYPSELPGRMILKAAMDILQTPRPAYFWCTAASLDQDIEQAIKSGCTVTGRCLSINYFGFGGDEEDRTPDLRIANATLSQLSYVPQKNCT